MRIVVVQTWETEKTCLPTMRAEGALDLVAMEALGAGPALGRAHQQNGPARPHARGVLGARRALNRPNFL